MKTFFKTLSIKRPLALAVLLLLLMLLIAYSFSYRSILIIVITVFIISALGFFLSLKNENRRNIIMLFGILFISIFFASAIAVCARMYDFYTFEKYRDESINSTYVRVLANKTEQSEYGYRITGKIISFIQFILLPDRIINAYMLIKHFNKC